MPCGPDSQRSKRDEAGQRDYAADIRLACGGDDAAFVRLLQRYEGRLVTHMGRFSANPVELEDLVQDVIVELYSSISTLKNPGSFPNWLWRIATRVGYRYWTKCGRDRDVLKGLMRSSERELRPVSSSAFSGHLYERDHLLASLEPIERRIMTFRYFQDMSYGEIARQMGWSAVRVRVRAHRARAKLRKILSDDVHTY